MNADQVKAEVVRIHELAKERFTRYLRNCPEVRFFRNSRTAGMARSIANIVEFNLDNAEQSPYDEFLETIIHEVAHIVNDTIYPMAKQNHGPEFRFICRVLGGVGTTYHNHAGTPPKRKHFKTQYLVRCGCRGHWISARKKNSMDAGTKLRCLVCNEIIPAKIHDIRSS